MSGVLSSMCKEAPWHVPYRCLIFFTRITNEGSLFYIRTNESAPQYKVITLDIANDHQIKEFIPENEATLTSVSCFNKDYFGVVYKRNVSHLFYQNPFLTSSHFY